LLEAGVSLAIWEAGKFFATGEIPHPLGSAHQSNAPYQAFRSADGWLTIGATTPPNWNAFCRALGLQRLLDDPRYTDTSLRFRHRDTLIPVIADVIIKKPTAHWLGLLERAGVPCAPIEHFDEVFTDRHLNARSYFWDAPHPTLGSVRQLGSPMRFSETPVRRQKAGPLLGEDSAALLAELGYMPAEIEALLARRIAAGPAQRVSG